MATKAKSYNWDANKVYRFELIGQGKDHKGKYMLPTQTIVYDESAEENREVRFSSTEKSPYVDDQKESSIASKSPIIFKRGRLEVSGREVNKLNYLMALDHNSEKKNRATKPIYQFRLINEEANFKAMADFKRTKLKVQLALSEASKEELLDFLQAEYNYSPRTDSHDELLHKAMAYAEQDPHHVAKVFNTEESRMKARLIEAFKDGTLKNAKGVVTWGDTGTEVKSFKLSEDNKLTDQMVDWISKGTKEATDFVKKLATKA